MAAEYAFECTLFVGASDAKMATLLAQRVAVEVNQPYQWDLEGETAETHEPVDVTLRIESEPAEMVPVEEEPAPIEEARAVRDVLAWQDVEGNILEVQLDQRADYLAVCVSYPDEHGSPVVSRWMHLQPREARELAEFILGRWGGTDPNAW
jgi:hypothetical protein